MGSWCREVIACAQVRRQCWRGELNTHSEVGMGVRAKASP